jgi:hypothetical protein
MKMPRRRVPGFLNSWVKVWFSVLAENQCSLSLSSGTNVPGSHLRLGLATTQEHEGIPCITLVTSVGRIRGRIVQYYD